MPKEKRTYNSEMAASTSLQLQRIAALDEKHLDHSDQRAANRQFFSPELISRLAERIKKL